MRGILLGLLATAGCGRIGFEALTEQVGTDDAAVLDAGPCDRSGTFSAPTPVAGVSGATAFEATMRLSANELRGYLWINVPGVDLAFAARATVDSPFVLSTITELSPGTSNEFEPTVSSDERVIVFSSNRAGGAGGLDLYIAQRAAASGPWSLVDGIAVLNATGDQHQPFLTDDALYFVSDGTGDPDIYRAPRTGATTFGAPVRIAELSQAGSVEADPVLSFDGLRMYFASDRATPGDIDIYEATRTSTTGAWSNITRLAAISTAATEGPSWESVDGCRLYLASAIRGTPDVFVAKRPP